MTKEEKIVMDKYAIGEIKPAEPSMNYVFVYGSLKSGFGNNRLLSDSRLIGEAITLDEDYHMISLGGFPGVIYGTKRIKGEVYQVNNEVFESLDRLEGNGHFYKRELTETILLDNPNGGKNHVAWIYVLVNQKSHYGSGTHKDRIGLNDYMDAEYWRGV